MPELLGVVGALAVVSALGLPILARGREAASQSASVKNRGNLRQIGQAMMQYAQDHDGRFAPMNYWSTNTYWWGETLGNVPYEQRPATSCDFSKGILTPYLRDRQALFSPALPLRRRKASPGVAFAYNYRWLGGNFQTESPETPENVATARISDVAQPARTVLFADSARWNHFDGDTPYLEENTFLGSPYPDQYPNFHGRHNGFGHVLFVDGSIHAFKPMRGVRSPGTRDAPANLGHLPQEWFDRE